MGALSITVASSELGSCIVVSNTHITVLAHLNEVESTIEATWELRNVNVKGELLTSQLEHFVVLVVGHHVHAAANVGS